ncbi:hypothetical protein JHK84_027694 [Glycine max]|nr:hypothetical protein JHK84_027694 [Glycine max]
MDLEGDRQGLSRPPLNFSYFSFFVLAERRDIYGAWEQYLGLEHDDSAPKKSYAVNQEINCCFVEWMCKLRCNINKRVSSLVAQGKNSKIEDTIVEASKKYHLRQFKEKIAKLRTQLLEPPKKMILRGKLRYTKVFNWDPFSNLKELYHESLEESYFSHLLTQIIRDHICSFVSAILVATSLVVANMVEPLEQPMQVEPVEHVDKVQVVEEVKPDEHV